MLKKKKSSIELSATVMVTIVVGGALLVMGINILYHLLNKSADVIILYDETYNNEVRYLMSDNNYHMMAWPKNIVVVRDKYYVLALAINNQDNVQKKFFLNKNITVYYYSDDKSPLFDVSNQWSRSIQTPWLNQNTIIIGGSTQELRLLTINTPKDILKGIYMITFRVAYDDGKLGCHNFQTCTEYGVAKLYLESN